MNATDTPVSRTIHAITTTPGMAGQSRIQAHVTVDVSGTVTDSIETFVGNDYGVPGPVVWFYGDQQVFVTEPGRFGERFNEDWVRAFFAPNDCGSPTGYVDHTEYCPSCERDNREGHYDNCTGGAPFPVGAVVEILAGGQWTGPYTVTDGEGRSAEHLVLRGRHGVFEHYNDAPHNLRRK